MDLLYLQASRLDLHAPNKGPKLGVDFVFFVSEEELVVVTERVEEVKRISLVTK